MKLLRFLSKNRKLHITEYVQEPLTKKIKLINRKRGTKIMNEIFTSKKLNVTFCHVKIYSKVENNVEKVQRKR